MTQHALSAEPPVFEEWPHPIILDGFHMQDKKIDKEAQCPSDVYELMRAEMAPLLQEQLHVLLINLSLIHI